VQVPSYPPTIPEYLCVGQWVIFPLGTSSLQQYIPMVGIEPTYIDTLEWFIQSLSAHHNVITTRTGSTCSSIKKKIDKVVKVNVLV
jgi:hypothetical protein